MNNLPLFSTEANEEIIRLRKRLAELECQQQVKTIEMAIDYANENANTANHWVTLIEDFAEQLRKGSE